MSKEYLITFPGRKISSSETSELTLFSFLVSPLGVQPAKIWKRSGRILDLGAMTCR